MRYLAAVLTLGSLTLCLAPSLTAQMEKRWAGRYDGRQFAKASPAVNTRLSQDLCLNDLNGRPWSLNDQMGRTVVLIKGSFT